MVRNDESWNDRSGVHFLPVATTLTILITFHLLSRHSYLFIQWPSKYICGGNNFYGQQVHRIEQCSLLVVAAPVESLSLSRVTDHGTKRMLFFRDSLLTSLKYFAPSTLDYSISNRVGFDWLTLVRPGKRVSTSDFRSAKNNHRQRYIAAYRRHNDLQLATAHNLLSRSQYSESWTLLRS